MPYDLKPIDIDVETTPYLTDPDRPGGLAEKGDRWTLNFGPQHPATHTTLRMVMELDGERVARVHPHIGYLHSGFEKLAEALDYNQYVTIVSRMDYSGPIYNDVSWHHAVEKLFDIDITPRCKAVRTILAELGRIQSHLLTVGASALDLGAFTGFIYGFNERESILDIMDYVSGQRFHPDYTRVGGAMADLPDEETFKNMVKAFIREKLPKALDDLEGLCYRNRIFRDRTEGIGVITREEAINFSATGPVARASGVKRDVRKDDPYLCYADNWDYDGAPGVEFKVPVATTGDVLGRFLVRMEEMRQSIHIIEQLIDDIPGGPMNAWADGKMAKPPKAEVYGSIEGLIEHFELVMTNRKWKAPINEVYACTETANGEHGFYLVSDGGPHAWRAKHRACSFIHFSMFAKMLEGHQLSDAVAILGSLNIIAAELDR
ncbi:MAG: NADH-quinone oxidoreductase subunit D [Planctomycetota bacterium]